MLIMPSMLICYDKLYDNALIWLFMLIKIDANDKDYDKDSCVIW